MPSVILFVLGSAALIYLSRKPLRHPGAHGFARFFAWECILGLIALNLPVWHLEPWSAHQLVSWVLLVLSAALPIHAVLVLNKHGKPTSERADEALYGFEKTSQLVTAGAFRYIRHPMYAALIFLAWGAFLKHFSWLGLVLVLAASVLLLITALRDEKECLAHFGEAYRAYMKTTRRFIPLVF